MNELVIYLKKTYIVRTFLISLISIAVALGLFSIDFSTLDSEGKTGVIIGGTAFGALGIFAFISTIFFASLVIKNKPYLIINETSISTVLNLWPGMMKINIEDIIEIKVIKTRSKCVDFVIVAKAEPGKSKRYITFDTQQVNTTEEELLNQFNKVCGNGIQYIYDE